jgi:hypothetical protein
MNNDMSALEAAIFWSKKQKQFKDVKVSSCKCIQDVLSCISSLEKGEVDYWATSAQNVYEVWGWEDSSFDKFSVDWKLRVFFDENNSN